MARTSPARAQAAAESAAQDDTAEAVAAAEQDAAEQAAAAEDEAPYDLEADPIVQRFVPAKVQGFLGIGGRTEAIRLLAEACYVFGIDPNPKLKPRELLSHRFDAGEPDGVPVIPPSVIMVTAGGLKIRYPVDVDTEHRLRIVYNAYRVNGKTGEKEVLPLPPDLTLPREHVDGKVRSSDHQYRTGYLREGGKSESDRRDKIAALRASGKLGG